MRSDHAPQHPIERGPATVTAPTRWPPNSPIIPSPRWICSPSTDARPIAAQSRLRTQIRQRYRISSCVCVPEYIRIWPRRHTETDVRPLLRGRRTAPSRSRPARSSRLGRPPTPHSLPNAQTRLSKARVWYSHHKKLGSLGKEAGDTVSPCTSLGTCRALSRTHDYHGCHTASASVRALESHPEPSVVPKATARRSRNSTIAVCASRGGRTCPRFRPAPMLRADNPCKAEMPARGG